MDVALHEDLDALRPLLGTWVGEGQGRYPTIEPFGYREEVVFGHVGKPFLAYRQSTKRLDTGLPAHAEAGYVRGLGGGRIELVLAHPTGIAEVSEGTVEADGSSGAVRLRLMSVAVATTPSAKEVTSVERVVVVEGDVLRYEVAMGAVGRAHQHHLAAELHRAG